MARTLSRRDLRFDSLESRQLLTAGGPSAEAQSMLEMINYARTNPAGAAERISTNMSANVVATLKYYGVDVNQAKQEISSATPQPPVAWNSQLANAAQSHSQDMANTQVQSHSGSDGSTINSRISNAGYGDFVAVGENAFAYASSVDESMQAFLFDWGVADKGHRRNLLQPNVSADDSFRDVGIGIVKTNNPKFGPMVVTQDFGNQANEKAQLIGTIYNDNNGNNFYNVGEGVGNVRITATNLATGKASSVDSWDAGGYQLALDPGQYQVVASVNNQVVKSTKVSMGSVNVLHDFVLSDSSDEPVEQQSAVTSQPVQASVSSDQAASTTTTFKVNYQSQPTSTPARTASSFLSKWSSWKANVA